VKSLVKELDGTKESIRDALQEAEYYSTLSGFGKEQVLQIRLLSEEMIGMATEVLSLSDGAFWIEIKENTVQICLSAELQVGEEARKKLLSVSSTGEDVLYQGIKGKIHQALDMMAFPGSDLVLTSDCNGFIQYGMISEWSLQQYRESVKRDKKALEWDELEKSILGKLSDDVRVGVLSNRVEITISKTFE